MLEDHGYHWLLGFRRTTCGKKKHGVYRSLNTSEYSTLACLILSMAQYTQEPYSNYEGPIL